MDFLFGVAVGWAQTAIGHPFDTYVVLTQIGRREKITARILYRGVTIPLACSATYNSMLFGVYSQTYKLVENHWIAGAIAGAAGGPVLCLTDSYKIGLQTQSKTRTLFKGVGVTTLLECPANSIYFGVYHILRSNQWSTWLSGGLAGISAWASVYPLDVIKTRIQSGVATDYKNAIKMGGFSKGLFLCLTRAFLTNALGFCIYDQMKILVYR